MFLSKSDPVSDNNLIRTIIKLQWPFLVQVELLELLNDDQDEQIEHHIGYQQDEWNEIDKGIRTATWLSFNTVGWSMTTIVHDGIPILACGDWEK